MLLEQFLGIPFSASRTRKMKEFVELTVVRCE
jgi:hypothetical protein